MKNEIRGTQEQSLSRRQVLKGTSALAAGVALTSLAGLVKPAAATGGKTEKWPWPYLKLDPAETAEIAYKEWDRVFCGAAVINSVFSQLREKIGEPYTSFPSDAFVFLEGGQVGWGTICGSLAGASIVANVILGPRIDDSILGPRIDDSIVGHQIAEDIMQWYTTAELPLYQPKVPKIKTKLPATISHSPLCHLSVGRWMKTANKSLGSPERKDRCARVAASTAYKLVELLNQWKAGEYASESEFSCGKTFGIPGPKNCTNCHREKIPVAPKMPTKAQGGF
ncbi:MAG: twin-arginine translocation signal domain-containing protein [Candidatus Electrothrix sp. GW3-4]|uniref:twin-arginine translocation signal domain-containing protein n=1 Tax=Candidatus Electrothrix sp. GW3-4 TaxID=3126740 RepID=UPI0030D19545